MNINFKLKNKNDTPISNKLNYLKKRKKEIRCEKIDVHDRLKKYLSSFYYIYKRI